MEQSEAFKSLLSTISSLEIRLANRSNEFEQHGTELEREIEEHFARCFNAFAARKDALLKELTQKVHDQKKQEEVVHAKWKGVLELCNKTIETASLMYTFSRTGAERVCEEVKNIAIPDPLAHGLKVEFPASLLELIQTYGKVDESTQLSTVSTATTTTPVPERTPQQQPAIPAFSVPFFLSPKKKIFQLHNKDDVAFVAGLAEGYQEANEARVQFINPYDICFNRVEDCFYVSDYINNEIRKLTPLGNVTTALNIEVPLPLGIAFNARDQSYFVTSLDNSIYKITSQGEVSHFAGGLERGKVDGIGTSARFCAPRGISIDQITGDIFVSDCGNHVIRKITQQGEVSTPAGCFSGFADGKTNKAKFNKPCGICFDAHTQSLIVCDTGNNSLRRVFLTGGVTTLCGVQEPRSVVLTANRTILVASKRYVFKVSKRGEKYEAVVIAGSGVCGESVGLPLDCAFTDIFGMAVHERSNSCYITTSNSIKKISFV